MQLEHGQRHAAGVASTSSSGAFTNTPATSQRRRSAVAISAARSSSHGAGCRTEDHPDRPGAAATASSASSSRVMPQIFTFADIPANRRRRSRDRLRRRAGDGVGRRPGPAGALEVAALAGRLPSLTSTVRCCLPRAAARA